jgi:hypothetical protein
MRKRCLIAKCDYGVHMANVSSEQAAYWSWVRLLYFQRR